MYNSCVVVILCPEIIMLWGDDMVFLHTGSLDVPTYDDTPSPPWLFYSRLLLKLSQTQLQLNIHKERKREEKSKRIRLSKKYIRGTNLSRYPYGRKKKLAEKH